MPAWVNPDILTGIGILGSIVVFAGYWLSNVNANYLWAASAGLVINWFGDSLDGTLARYRKIERPKYGFFVDHTVDAFSQLLVVIGLGLSPYVTFEVACLALIGYLMMSILTYVRTYVDGVFRISYGRFGPTEIRAIVILINFLFYFVEAPDLTISSRSVSIYDMLVGALAVALVLVFLISTYQKAAELARSRE
jgi:phosphatidylglycerophosphate synthase